MNTSDYQDAVERLERPTIDREAHAIMGLCSEAGELAALYKRVQLALRPALPVWTPGIQRSSVASEVGDCLYYLGMLCNIHDLDIADVMAVNIAKLERRAEHGKDKAGEFEEIFRGFDR